MSLGEFEYLKWIFGELKASPRVTIRPGDDCAGVKTGGRDLALVSTDVVLEGSHFEGGASGAGVGWKSIGVSLSDCAAMGVEPAAVVAGVGFNRGVERSFAEDLVRGMKEITEKYGVDLVGGDVTSWDGPTAICSTVFAFCGEMDPVLRKGAAPGDGIYVTGELGGSIRGRHLWFEPRVEEGVFLARRGFASSMMDISDGLGGDLRHLIEEHGLGARIKEDALPVSAAAAEQAKETGKTAAEHAITDGEDFELLFTVRPAMEEELERKWPFETKLSRVGEVTKQGLVLVKKYGVEESFDKYGYEHRFGK